MQQEHRSAPALYMEHLFQAVGVDLQGTRRVKLVRHIDKRVDVHELHKKGLLEAYQSLQSKPCFDRVELVLAFLGLPASHAIFVGAFAVGARTSAGARKPNSDSPLLPIWSASEIHYEMTKRSGLAALEDRLVIDWGKGALAWRQWFKPASKEVVELLPTGYVNEFPGYLEVRVDMHELKRIIKHPISHRRWHQMLAATAGIYLILDKRSGAQYIGSAYGARGLLGRWQTYATTGHGDNKQLVRLVEQVPDAADHFQFSILQTLPLTLTPREVIEHEGRHKQKLGSRAHGLNSN